MSLPEIPPFAPHRLFRGGHAQTIAGVYLPSKRFAYSAHRHCIELDDGDQIVLHEDRPTAWTDGDRIALLIHGLGGCHGSPYMARIAAKLSARGVRVFRKDLRGWGAGAKTARQPFHAARTADIAAALQSIHENSPASPVALVGFSLGANMILRLLGDVAGGPKLPASVDRALAVAPPIDLMRCCRNLARGFGRVYDRNYARFLWNHVRARRDVVPEFAAALSARRPQGIYDFDARFTAPLSGFESVEHYYNAASSVSVLSQIKTPTLILSAVDDPIVPGRVLEEATFSAKVTLHLTEHGGHLGYISAAGGEPDRRWMDWRAVDFVTHP